MIGFKEFNEGFKKDVTDYYRWAGVFLYNSQLDATPNVILEAKAHVVAIERMLENNNKTQLEYFNLGTGNGVSVLECIKSFEKITGKKVDLVEEGELKGRNKLVRTR